MNYRHHYHAGNYADVFKHVLLLLLFRGLQRKEKGFLFVDTHAGRGGYDLTIAPVLPGGRAREPEWPAGIGRVWGRQGLPAAIGDYLQLVARYEAEASATGVRGAEDTGLETRATFSGDSPRYYPGSPWIARLLARPQDRLALCELRPDDAEALAQSMAGAGRAKVLETDGYAALRALLPPPERRALVLIDPPFEEKGEYAAVAAGLAEALRRLPGATIAVWYPITERSRVDDLHEAIIALGAPALAAEIEIAGDSAQVRMKGCGLAVLNPPWRIEDEIRPLLPVLVDALRVDDGAAVRCRWLVPEK